MVGFAEEQEKGSWVGHPLVEFRLTITHIQSWRYQCTQQFGRALQAPHQQLSSGAVSQRVLIQT